ncbi:hypothetical protein SDC9_206412 [bioreactor metagenome]|uniref:Uncharacterized protein n=1 Tax=bioreactor metagenome TaxID=1076179 RepID=A0A645J4Z7_9ZZZZ
MGSHLHVLFLDVVDEPVPDAAVHLAHQHNGGSLLVELGIDIPHHLLKGLVIPLVVGIIGVSACQLQLLLVGKMLGGILV